MIPFGMLAADLALKLPQMDLNYLLNFGVAGGVLYWFMIKFETRMRRVEEALDRQTRATVLDIMTRPTASPVARAEAHKIANEIIARRGNGSGDITPGLEHDPSKP
jgi:hypothetical protein